MLKPIPCEVLSTQLFLSSSWTPAIQATVKQHEQKGMGRVGLLLPPQVRDCPGGAKVAMSTLVP